MSKGLGRALSRAPVGTEMFIKRFRYPVNSSITVTATGSANGFGTGAIGKLPEGNVVLVAAAGYLTITTVDADVGATWSGLLAIGTTADADDNVASPATDSNIVASTAIGPAVAKTIANQKVVSAVPGLAAIFNNTAGTTNLNLQLRVNNADMADSSNAPMTVTGYLDLFMAVIGDN